jgi:hypothetical protein
LSSAFQRGAETADDHAPHDAGGVYGDKQIRIKRRFSSARYNNLQSDNYLEYQPWRRFPSEYWILEDTDGNAETAIGARSGAGLGPAAFIAWVAG